MGFSRSEIKALGLDHLFHGPEAKAKAISVPKAPRVPYEPWPCRWVLVIPGWRPTFTSELKCHPMKAAMLKKKDLRVIEKSCVIHGVKPAFTRRHVSLEIENRFGNYPDDDAPWKAFLDALKGAGAIVDDSREWCEVHWPPKYRRGTDKVTIVTLTDIEPLEEE